MIINDKVKRFAQAHLQGLTNREAAIFAGYSEKTASQKGSALMKDPDVIAYIEKLKKVKAEVKVKVDPEDVDNCGFVPTHTDELIKNSAALRDPLTFLLGVMADDNEEMRSRIDAAKSALPYVHSKIGEKGKKENQKDEALRAASDRFGTQPPPKRLN